MPRFFTKPLAAAALTLAAALAHAQQGGTSVTLYGTLDVYAGYFHSSSGTSLKGLYDGAFLRSRWGLRGVEDLGAGLLVKYQLEAGFNTDTGTTADTRAWDRQAWVGVSSYGGELRLGRQNTPIFYKGDYIDFTSRTLGSVVNAFGVPSRYDNAIGYISPRWAGLQIDAQYSLGETSAGLSKQGVMSAGVDYLYGPFRVGAAALRGKPPSGAAYSRDVVYDNAYANFDYGQGKIYLAYVRSNNSTAAAAGNNTGTLLSNVGGLVAGTNPDVNRFYRIVQLSADYRLSGALRVGALWGKITDQSGSGRDADGWGLGAYYDLSKRTMLYALGNSLNNKGSAGFRPAGSAGLGFNFTNPNDVNGRKISGVQLGMLHRF